MRRFGGCGGLTCGALATALSLGCEEKKPAPAAAASVAPAASAPVEAPSAASPTRCTATAEPVKLTVAMGSIYGLTTHGTDVFYTSWHIYGSRGAVNKVPKGGGPNTTLETMELEPRGLAVDGDGIFYTSGIRLMRLPLAGGSSTLLAPQFSAQVLALHGGEVYGVPADYGPYDRIVKIAYKGGEEKELADAPRPKSDESPLGYHSIAVDTSGVYVSDAGNNRVLAFPLTGGKPKTLAARQPRAFALVIDADNAYFDLAKDGSLLSVSKSGGTPKKIASGLVPSARLAIAGSDLFTPIAAEGGPAKLSRISIDGSKTTSIASVPPDHSVEAITADDDCVYWAQHDTSGRTTLYAAARPK
jgi:hypothetical protein